MADPPAPVETQTSGAEAALQGPPPDRIPAVRVTPPRGRELRGARNTPPPPSQPLAPGNPDEYLARHGVQPFMDELLQELRTFQPPDPYAYLSSRAAAHTRLGPPSPKQSESEPEWDRDQDTGSGFDSDSAVSEPVSVLSPAAFRPCDPAADYALRDAGLPALNVIILVVGSRGDVQPFVALGQALQGRRHRVRIATHIIFRDFVLEQGLDFFPIAGDAHELMRFMVQHPDLITFSTREIEAQGHQMMEIYQSTYLACTTPTKTHSYCPDIIIANPPVHVACHIAERLHVPLHVMFTMPWTPTAAYPHPFASPTSLALGNAQSYTWVDRVIWLGCGSQIQAFRQKVLGLPKCSYGATLVHDLKIPHTYCMSPSLVPKPPDWGPHIDVVGFWCLDACRDYDAATAAPELLEFLEAGAPPVYIGFGSIVVKEPQALFDCVVEGVRRSGMRAIIHQGWTKLNPAAAPAPQSGADPAPGAPAGGPGSDPGSAPGPAAPAADPGVFLLDKFVPLEWLFARCAAVCHHGGAGTVAAGLRAGTPMFVVPFFGDQAFWGRNCAREGLGPEPVPHLQLTPDALAAGLRFCLRDDVVAAARRMGESVRQEDGLAAGVAAFERHLPVRDGRWVCEVWEFQRWYWVVGWSPRLLPTDRYGFADATGLCARDMNRFPLPQGWRWDGGWEVEADPAAPDPDGWEFAKTWVSGWHGAVRHADGLRRRKWVRTRSPVLPGSPRREARLHSTRLSVLYVTVVEGQALQGPGRARPVDPYVRMYVVRGGQVCQKQRTKVLRGSAAPVWNQIFFFACLVGDVLHVDCRAQKTQPPKYSLIGSCDVPLDSLPLEEAGAYDMWVPLEPPGPSVHLRWSWHQGA